VSRRVRVSTCAFVLVSIRTFVLVSVSICTFVLEGREEEVHGPPPASICTKSANTGASAPGALAPVFALFVQE
jgi:hypothetical protein